MRSRAISAPSRCCAMKRRTDNDAGNALAPRPCCANVANLDVTVLDQATNRLASLVARVARLKECARLRDYAVTALAIVASGARDFAEDGELAANFGDFEEFHVCLIVAPRCVVDVANLRGVLELCSLRAVTDAALFASLNVPEEIAKAAFAALSRAVAEMQRGLVGFARKRNRAGIAVLANVDVSHCR